MQYRGRAEAENDAANNNGATQQSQMGNNKQRKNESIS